MYAVRKMFFLLLFSLTVISTLNTVSADELPVIFCSNGPGGLNLESVDLVNRGCISGTSRGYPGGGDGFYSSAGGGGSLSAVEQAVFHATGVPQSLRLYGKSDSNPGLFSFDPANPENSPSGTWSISDGTPVHFMTVKAANSFALFKLSPSSSSGIYSALGMLTLPGTNTPGVSYISFWILRGPPGAPDNIDATDGDFTDKVVVTWDPPFTGGEVSSYDIYRSTNPSAECLDQNIIGSVPPGTQVYDDTSAVPGVLYYYTVKSTGPDGEACGATDSGYAGILPPDIEVSKIEEPQNGFLVSWKPPPGAITGYQLYRSESPDSLCKGDPVLEAPSDVFTYEDFDVEEEIQYYYTIKALSEVGESPCSKTGIGFLEKTILLSPAFAKFNTYLGQQNFAELINQGSRDKPVKISVFNLRGELMVFSDVIVKANQQIDVDINAMIRFVCNELKNNCEGFEDLSAFGAPNGLGKPDGTVDTYGLVRFEFDDSDPAERIQGRMSFYRPNINGSYSFAFAREFRNPVQGKAYGIANTHDPRGMGFLVPNWVELISFGVSNGSNGNESRQIDFQPLGYTINMYDQSGTRRSSRHVVLQPMGELDLQGGHEFVNEEGKVIQGVYMVEVVPDNPKAEYFLSIARYSSNAPPSVDPETYNYAFVVDARNGTSNNIFAPIGNHVEGVQGASDKIFGDNWVEVACVSEYYCEGFIRFIAANGSRVANQYFKINPKSQFHYNAALLLPPRTSGSVHIEPLIGSVIGQSMTYLHGDQNDLQSAFASPARPPGGEVQSGSINTYLGMQNVLKVFSVLPDTSQATYLITSFTGGNLAGVLNPGSEGVESLTLGDTLSFPFDTYGALILTTSDFTEDAISGEVRRVRVTDDGRIDFVMPTLLK